MKTNAMTNLVFFQIIINSIIPTRMEPFSAEEIEDIVPENVDAEKVFNGLFLHLGGLTHYINTKHLVNLIEGLMDLRNNRLHHRAQHVFIKRFVLAYVEETQAGEVHFMLDRGTITAWDEDTGILGMREGEKDHIAKTFFSPEVEVNTRMVRQNLHAVAGGFRSVAS